MSEERRGLTPIQDELADVRTICEAAGVELKGEDGQPFCCGERMYVGEGVLGPNYARCDKCGKEIRNLASPHVNGGYLMSDDWFAEHGDRTWMAFRPTRVEAAV